MKQEGDLDLGVLIDDLTFSYGQKTVLQSVSIALRPGRFTALLGPNGAGKSTLVALLSRLFITERGRIEILGQDLRQNPRAALKRMGIIFQEPTLDLDLTVRQNMAYFAALHGISGSYARQRINSCLDMMSLADRGAEKVRLLNGGHRRRLEVARSLIHDPDFLLVDEPTVGLDVPSRVALVEHAHALCAERGLTILWATHLVDEVWPDDDLVILHRGAVQAAGPVSEVLSACGCNSVLAAFEYHTTTGTP